MAKFFLVVEPSCLKKRVSKPKCAVTNVDWNNLTFEFLAKDEQNLLGTTSNYLRGRQEISEHFKAWKVKGMTQDGKFEAWRGQGSEATKWGGGWSEGGGIFTQCSHSHFQSTYSVNK